MKKICFAIALHFHQPVGNFGNIFERASQRCYIPFLKLLKSYPQIKITCHISGSLLDYLELKHPEIVNLLKEMVASGQIEMLGGGYYEPIFTAIPERDLVGQINMMNSHLNKKFNYVPKGVWIPERVWDPKLSRLLSELGMSYCVLDDTHLKLAGVKKKDIRNYFTAEGGISIVGSDKALRYKIPFHNSQETVEYLRCNSIENGLFVYGDDVEKFGEWPGTHRWVYKQKWLSNFFDKLIENRNWIKIVKLSEYLEKNKPKARLKIPEASYKEMMDWSRGRWSNFLLKYPEANQMHKKMIYVSNKIEELSKITNKKHRNKIEKAKKELYKGQCNCAYWHGVFGGLYLYHLRQAVYSHLINADRIIDNIIYANKSRWVALKNLDYDLDGKNEVILESRNFSLYLDPYEGGTLKELDFKPLYLNLINSLSRKKEVYHKKISKKSLDYDKLPRYCLRDYILTANSREIGGFSNGFYKVKQNNRSVLLERKTKALNAELKLSKKIKIKSENKIEITYTLKKSGSIKNNLILGIEFNLTMPYLNSLRYKYISKDNIIGELNRKGLVKRVSSFKLADLAKQFGLNWCFSKEAECIRYFPVETISQSEKGYKRNYQASCITPYFRVSFDKTDSWQLVIDWEFKVGNESS